MKKTYLVIKIEIKTLNKSIFKIFYNTFMHFVLIIFVEKRYLKIEYIK
jgi:hypothetical protein